MSVRENENCCVKYQHDQCELSGQQADGTEYCPHSQKFKNDVRDENENKNNIDHTAIVQS